MKNLTIKEGIISGLLGLSGFLTAYSFILLIYYFTNITKLIYPIKYVVPTFIMSLIVWLYCFYTARAIKKQKYSLRNR